MNLRYEGMEKKPGGCGLPNVVLIWKAWVVLFCAVAVGAAVVAADASNQINNLEGLGRPSVGLMPLMQLLLYCCHCRGCRQ